MDSELEVAVSNDRVTSWYRGMFLEVDWFVAKSFNWWGYKFIQRGELDNWI